MRCTLLDRLYRLGWPIRAMAVVFMAVSPLHAHLREMQFLFHRGGNCRGRGAEGGNRGECLTALYPAPGEDTVDY
jgi:hypothetical protein